MLGDPRSTATNSRESIMVSNEERKGPANPSCCRRGEGLGDDRHSDDVDPGNPAFEDVRLHALAVLELAIPKD